MEPHPHGEGNRYILNDIKNSHRLIAISAYSPDVEQEPRYGANRSWQEQLFKGSVADASPGSHEVSAAVVTVKFPFQRALVGPVSTAGANLTNPLLLTLQ